MTSMSALYAIPDLHGRFDLLELAIQTISTRGGGTVVFLGDYIDHGPSSRQIIERLIGGPPQNQAWITLSGNHEAMLLQHHMGRHRNFRAFGSGSSWLESGGDATLKSYAGPIPHAHFEWLRGLQRIYVTSHHIFVHAGVDPDLPLNEQPVEMLLWHRYSRWADVGHGARHLVHGHTPHRDGPERLTNRTNLDTLAWKTGSLAVGVFDSEAPGGPVDILRIIESSSYGSS